MGVNEGSLQVGDIGKLTYNRVAKKMGTYFEMGTDGHRFICFEIGSS